MSDAFIGEIRAFGFQYAPKNWLLCNGQSVEVEKYKDLHSVIGTAYGTSGQGYFNVPDLQGRAVAGTGVYPINKDHYIRLEHGKSIGSSSVSLNEAGYMPSHFHQGMAMVEKKQLSREANENSYVSLPRIGPTTYDAWALMGNRAPLPMNSSAISTVGQALPHNNVSPYLAMNFCICAVGGVLVVRPKNS